MKLLRHAVIAAVAALSLSPAAGMAFERQPWKISDRALVVDAYELNTIDWDEMSSDKRIAGFISKASDGLPEIYNCKGKHNGDTIGHCKTMWRKYAVSRELYQTRRLLAKSRGLLWGAYHLGRPGNPIDQANHFLDYAKPADDEMMVLDIEGLNSELYMSLEDAQIFARHIKTRTGRYPVLYTNNITARYIAARRDEYRLLSRLPLWYARYKPEIVDVFPMGNWDRYALWQFSSSSNCGNKSCPYRVKGTLNDIDVNVADLTVKQLAKIWPHGNLIAEKPPAMQMLVSATATFATGAAPKIDMMTTASIERPVGMNRRLNYGDY